MKQLNTIFLATLFLLLSAFVHESVLNAQVPATVKGVVFHDKNGNEVYDSSDKPLKGVAVSNGRDVVLTNRKGEYELLLRDNSAIFVIQPANWVAPVDENRKPVFYQMYSSGGATGTKFEGMPPTGPLPESVDFPLLPKKAPRKFKALIFGDTQPRNDTEIYYMAKDVLHELIDTDSHFGITLGDIVFDNLSLYDHVLSSLSTLGIPMWYVPGNHDSDYTGTNKAEFRGAWRNKIGPLYYSFSYGQAHFIVLDNILWIFEEGKNFYRTGLGKDQMQFLRNEIQRIDKNKLLVLLAHIPYESSTAWHDKNEKREFYELLATHPNSVSLTAHTHRHFHRFIDSDDGYPGSEPHHLISVGTVCGAWWSGAPNEFGIPHAMMSDGTPNGYGFLHINKSDWKFEWKPAGMNAGFQMQIDAPDFIETDAGNEIKVTANIFNALPDAVVKMKIGDDGNWIEMKRVTQTDPVRLAQKEWEEQINNVPWRKMGGDSNSLHIWEATYSVKENPGVYNIRVNAKDAWFEYEGNRLIHIK